MSLSTLSHLECRLWKAAWLLKGPVDAADLETQIFPLLFSKLFSDVHEEERFQVLEDCNSVTATPLPPILGAATSTVPRRRAPPTSSRRRRGKCGASSSKPTSSSTFTVSAQTSSTTGQWTPASSCGARRNPKPGAESPLFTFAMHELTSEWAQRFLPADHIQRVVRAGSASHTWCPLRIFGRWRGNVITKSDATGVPSAKALPGALAALL